MPDSLEPLVESFGLIYRASNNKQAVAVAWQVEMQWGAAKQVHAQGSHGQPTQQGASVQGCSIVSKHA